jgi:hypothetical protein
MEFYLDQPLTNLNIDGSGKLPPKPFILSAQSDIISGLAAKGWQMQTIHTFDKFWISRLKPAFLNKSTRDKAITQNQLVIVR